MAQGMSEGILDVSLFEPNMCGKVVAKAVEVCTAAKCAFPTLSLWSRSVSLQVRMPRRLFKPVCEAEDSFARIISDVSRDLDDVGVECAAHELKVAEEKGLFNIKSNRKDVSRIAPEKGTHFFQRVDFLTEQKFLIVSHHDDKWNVENVL
jgi:hypothetical protein